MNRQSLFKEVELDLQKQRFEAELLADEHLKEMREKCKEFRFFDDELRITQFECGQEAEMSLEKTKKLVDDLKKKREQALVDFGKPKDYVSPHRLCKICDDTGVFNGEKCACFLQRLQQKLIANSGLKVDVLHDFSESDPKILEGNPKLAKIHEIAHAYTEKFPNVKTKNLVFFGEVGTGKTFLLECIASKLLERQFFVVYATAFNLQNTMTKALTAPIYERELIMSPLLESDLLIVDDLGSEPFFKGMTVSSLFSVVNEREAKNKATLISTNLGPDEIEARYGNRLFSRIFNKRTTKVILFEGKDLRINN